jgi:hypothetical protein
MTTMPREPSAAQALFPHLPHDDGQPVQRLKPASVAAALYPGLRSNAPPQPPTQREVREAWVERMMEMSGLRRKR